jgi:hypothetical protein
MGRERLNAARKSAEQSVRLTGEGMHAFRGLDPLTTPVIREQQVFAGLRGYSGDISLCILA